MSTVSKFFPKFFTEHNLSKQPQMLQLRQETASKLKAVTELRSLHEKLFLEYQTLASKYSPQNIKVSIFTLCLLTIISSPWPLTKCSAL